MPTNHSRARARLSWRLGASLTLAMMAIGLPVAAQTRTPNGAVLQQPAPNGQLLRVTSPEEAISLALTRSPAVGAAEARVAAARGDLTQAGLRPNPTVDTSMENVAGSGGYRGFRSAQTTVQLSQRLEVGGQRSARQGVAQNDVTLAGQDLAALRLDLVRAVRQAYAEAVATREASRLAADAVRLANEVLRVARERVGAGSDPELQQRRAEVAVATANLNRQRTERDAESARRGLAVLLAAQDVNLATSERWFNDIGADPGRTNGLNPAANPDFARWRDEQARADAALTLERRRAIPDITVGAGYRRFSDTSDSAAILSLSIPLPVFDRNQGNIARATADVTRIERLGELNRTAISATLVDAASRLDQAWRDADGLRRVILPGAEQAYRFAREGFSGGRYSLLEVLDAQRVLLEARNQLNLALRDLHARRADVDRLSGRGPEATPVIPAGAR